MSDDFKFQLSVKIDGQHLLNIRGGSSLEFFEGLKDAVESAELIVSAARAFAGTQQPQATPAQPPPAPVQNAHPGATSHEIGPVQIKGISKTSLKKDGTAMKSPRFTVEFSNGKRHSTFDSTVAQAAETLSGRPVFYETDDSEYKNLTNVRSAGA